MRAALSVGRARCGVVAASIAPSLAAAWLAGQQRPRAPRGAPSGTARRRSGRSGDRAAGRSRGRGVRRVVELLLGAEERVEDLAAQALAGGDRDGAADDRDEQELAHAALALGLGLGVLGRVTQRGRRVAQRVGGALEVLVQLLVLDEDLRRRLAVLQAAVRVLRGLEGHDHVVAQLLVLDDPLDVRVVAHVARGGCGGAGLVLRCHVVPHLGFACLRRAYTRSPLLTDRSVRLERGASPSCEGSSAACRTCPIWLTKLKFRRLRRCSGISSMSASLSCGAMIVVMPLRWAASALSFRPPIGSTCPVSVISPVIATSSRTSRPPSSEASAVAIVIPALGPSLGIAPAGTWMWMSCVRNQSDGRSGASSDRCPRTYDSAADADSFMTSPSCPVICSLPSPSNAAASMNSTSPPTGVHARPVATPGVRVRRRASEW